MRSTKNITITLEYVFQSLLALLVTFALHEGAHYMTGTALGYDMWYSLNAVGLNEGQQYQFDWENQLTTIAGPLFTLLQALLVYYIIRKTRNLKWYPLLFAPVLMRIFSAGISFLNNPNDEARVSEWLGLGKMTLHLILCLVLIVLLYGITKEFKINWKINSITYIIMCIGITIIVFSNQYIIKT